MRRPRQRLILPHSRWSASTQKIWAAAALLGVALLGTGSLLLKFKGAPVAAEREVSYSARGYSLLTRSHQIVILATASVQQHVSDRTVSKKISDALTEEDRLGRFQGVQSSRELATLLTQRVRDISHDDRYQVLYSLIPPDIEEAHGRSIYRITEHLSVGLPSL